jgi:peptidoglycan hydrolase FlgJ
MPNQINDIASAENQVQSIFGGSNNAGVNDIASAEQQVKSIFGSNNSPTTNTSNPSSSSWDEFKQTANQIAEQENFPVNVLLGQAALESGRGEHAPGNNYFGIKAQGTAGTNNLKTSEYGNNGYYQEQSNFGAYNTPADSIQSYIDLIKNNPRYAPAYQQYLLDHDSVKLLQGIKAGGYATSPTYVQNVSSMPEFQGGSQ